MFRDIRPQPCNRRHFAVGIAQRHAVRLRQAPLTVFGQHRHFGKPMGGLAGLCQVLQPLADAFVLIRRQDFGSVGPIISSRVQPVMASMQSFTKTKCPWISHIAASCTCARVRGSAPPIRAAPIGQSSFRMSRSMAKFAGDFDPSLVLRHDFAFAALHANLPAGVVANGTPGGRDPLRAAVPSNQAVLLVLAPGSFKQRVPVTQHARLVSRMNPWSGARFPDRSYPADQSTLALPSHYASRRGKMRPCAR